MRSSKAHAFVTDLDEPRLDDDDRHHLERVLRLRPGEPVSVSDGEGRWRLCTWRPGGTLEPAGDVAASPRPSPLVTVGFALMKGDRPEWTVQKLTELGVDRIVPLHTARAVVRWDEARARRQVERLRRIAREAAMQSRRVWLPDVAPVLELAVAVALAGATLAEPGGAPPTLERACVLIGPEGGWTPDELACGLPQTDLGPTVLRAETAAVAAGVLLCALRAGSVSAKSVPSGSATRAPGTTYSG